VLFRKTKRSSDAEIKKDALLSVLARDMHVLGTLVSDGTLDFSGTVDGNVRCHTLTIRAEGSIRGDVTADVLHVYGKINGLIRAKHVHLYENCHVEGIIMHETLTMEDGAFLDGSCKRTDKPVSDSDFMIDSSLDEHVETTASRMFDNIRLIS